MDMFKGGVCKGKSLLKKSVTNLESSAIYLFRAISSRLAILVIVIFFNLVKSASKSLIVIIFIAPPLKAVESLIKVAISLIFMGGPTWSLLKPFVTFYISSKLTGLSPSTRAFYISVPFISSIVLITVVLLSCKDVISWVFLFTT